MNIAIQNSGVKQVSAATVATHSHVCTLFEGGYHRGLAALTNSLVANGFSGTIWAGYRDALPPWAKGNTHVVNDAVRLEFLSLNPDVHFANYKPQFMLDLIRSGRVDTKFLWYFDPDIVVDTDWNFFVRWSKFGVCLVEDINGNFPDDHPTRMEWKEQASSIGLDCARSINRYFNSGFIGVPCLSTRTLELWNALIAMVSERGSDLNSFMPGDRGNAFYAIDQDAMNTALMYDDGPHCTMGPEAMAFVPGYAPMAHAIGRPKPWEGYRIFQALKGIRPSMADKLFYRNCDGPIPVFSPLVRRLRRFDLTVASAVGRFYRRA